MTLSSLPISQIRQHVFCPRIPYYSEVLGLKVKSPAWTKQGQEHHYRQVLLSKKRTLARYNLTEAKMYFNYFVKSKLFRVHGQTDALLESEDQVYVVEFKQGYKLHRNHVMQVVAYSLAAEETLGKKSPTAFILLGDKAKAQRVEITSKIIAEFKEITQELYSNLAKPILPDSSASAYQCGQCEFLNFCNDRF